MKKIFYVILVAHCILKIDNCVCQSPFQRAIGGSQADFANFVIQTTEGGYAIAGYTSSFGAGNGDMFIHKFDQSGTLQWSKTVGSSGIELARCLLQTTDGGFIAAGGEGSTLVVKLDGSGNLQWAKNVGGIGVANAIIQTLDGGYAMGCGPNGGSGITKLDVNGTIQWSKTVQGGIYSILQTPSGGFTVAGGTSSFGAGISDVYIVKFDANGSLQWTRTVGGPSNENGTPSGALVQTTDGGYAVAGSTFSFPGSWNIYMVKLDGSGTLQWTKTVGGSNEEYGTSIARTTNGCVIAGMTWSFSFGFNDMYIVTFDSSWNTCGNVQTVTSSSGTGGTTTSPTPTVTAVTPTVTTPSLTVGSGGNLTQVCGIVGISPEANEVPGSFELFQNYPNPFNPKTVIRYSSIVNSKVRLSVYDVLGNEIETLVNEELEPGTYEVSWDAANYPSGVYYYKLTVGDYNETKRMVLIK